MPPASVAPFPQSNQNPGFNYQTPAQLNSIEPGTSAAGHGHYLAPMQLGHNVPFQQTRQDMQFQLPPPNLQFQQLSPGVQFGQPPQGVQFQHPRQALQYPPPPPAMQFQQTQEAIQLQAPGQGVQFQLPSPGFQFQQVSPGVQLQQPQKCEQLQQPQQQTGHHALLTRDAQQEHEKQRLQHRIKELERELGDARVRLAESEEARVELETRVESLDASNATLQEQLDVEADREAERRRSPYVHTMFFASSPIYKAFGPAATSWALIFRTKRTNSKLINRSRDRSAA